MTKSQYVEFLKRQIALLQWALEQAEKEEPTPPPPKEPPTERQLNYLLQIGYKGPLPSSRESASKLIEKIIKERTYEKRNSEIDRG